MDLPEATSVIFEGGVRLRREAEGQWGLRTLGNGHLASGAKQVAEHYGIRPIVVEYPLDFISNSSRPHPWTVLAPQPSPLTLDQRVNVLWWRAMTAFPDASRFIGMHVAHLLGGAVYHCKALAGSYADLCDYWSHFPAAEVDALGLRDMEAFPTAGTAGQAYECDGIISSVWRAYELSRHLLWSIAGHKSKVPENFEKTLKKCRAELPETLVTHVQSFLDGCMDIALLYRHCLEHRLPLYAAPAALGAWAIVKLVEDDVVTASLYLPLDPKASGRGKRMMYRGQTDALTWSWQLAASAIAATEAVFDGIGQAQAP